MPPAVMAQMTQNNGYMPGQAVSAGPRAIVACKATVSVPGPCTDELARLGQVGGDHGGPRHQPLDQRPPRVRLEQHGDDLVPGGEVAVEHLLEEGLVGAARPVQKGEQERLGSFLKQLRGRTPLLNILPYAEWMSVRTLRNLLTHTR